MRPIFFVLHPGWLDSPVGPSTYVTYEQLVTNYRLTYSQCICMANLTQYPSSEVCLVHLYPRADGDYQIPKPYRGKFYV